MTDVDNIQNVEYELVLQLHSKILFCTLHLNFLKFFERNYR